MDTNQSSAYPNISDVFVRSSLLEAGIKEEDLGKAITVKDPELAEKELTGRRAAKAAKSWGPVIVNNAINDPEFPDLSRMRQVLSKIEFILSDASDNEWFVAMKEAADNGVALSYHINHLSKAKKSLLVSQRKQWKDCADGVERVLGSWVKENGASISQYLRDNSSESGISLKKIRKIKQNATE